MDKDGKDWWGETDAFSSKKEGYGDFKKDSDSFQEKEGEEHWGGRSEWKQYDDRCYSDSKEEWGGYSDYAGEDSERGDTYKEWGFGKEEWEASMGESTNYSKWEEDKYKGEPSEEYKEDFYGAESEGESEDIETSSYFSYDDVLGILEQEYTHNTLLQNNYVTKYKAMSKKKK